jgi:UDP-N-acetylmuramoyl-L-alanyl-D-glutamate--2,6-diaminopimelate ligase
MGLVASRLSDVAVLTSDNPRDEEPLFIIEEIRSGIPLDAQRRATIVVEPDRRLAIRRVLEDARAGDAVVIAGKGHETYQEIGGRQLPFDDAVEARLALSVRFPTDPSTWMTMSSSEATPESS